MVYFSFAQTLTLHPAFPFSLAPFIALKVVTVKTEKDRDHCLHKSKLPFYAVHLLLDLPKNAALPVATVQHTKALLSPGGMWEHRFDHMYFTGMDAKCVALERVGCC